MVITWQVLSDNFSQVNFWNIELMPIVEWTENISLIFVYCLTILKVIKETFLKTFFHKIYIEC